MTQGVANAYAYCLYDHVTSYAYHAYAVYDYLCIVLYVEFHIMYADWSVSLSLCARCVSQERAMITG